MERPRQVSVSQSGATAAGALWGASGMAHALLPDALSTVGVCREERAVGRHDGVFKTLMGEVGVAEALLRERLPRPLVARFVGPPERVSESFIDEALRHSFADWLARVPLVGAQQAYVYCLIEHKRSPDKWVALQMWRYFERLYARLRKLTRGGRMPSVIGLVVYNGTRRWTVPTRFSSLVDVAPSLRRFVPDFEYLVMDLGAIADDALSAHPTLMGGLLALKSSAVPPGRRLAALKRSVRLLAPLGRSTLLPFFRYLEAAGGQPTVDQMTQMVRELAPDVEDDVPTIGELLMKKGRRKGRVEGRVEALREVLTRLLLARFAKLPPGATRKVATADHETLMRWCELALSERSLEAVFKNH